MKHFLPALKIFLFLTVITGVVYPLLITILGSLLFPNKAAGDFISRNGQVIGARMISQKFVNVKYFWGRPSAVDYNPLPSGGSNLGPTSEALKKAVNDRAEGIRKAYGLSPQDAIPQDLLFASGSGLDPEISPNAAFFQVSRVVKARGLSADKAQAISDLITKISQAPDLGFLGEPRVNVLELNLALDELTGAPTIPPPPDAK